MAFDRPHLQMPFTRGANGKVNCVEQDTTEHIESQERSVALCPLGYRTERPDFGWPMPDASMIPPDPGPLIAALDRLVPLPGGGKRDAQVYSDLAADPSNWHIEIDSEVP